MTVSLELNGISLTLLAVAFGLIAVGAAKAMGWVLTSPKYFTPAVSWILFGIALFLQQLGALQNENGERFLQGWATMLFTLFLWAGTWIQIRSRPDELKQEMKAQSKQLVEDFSRMYGKQSDDADK